MTGESFTMTIKRGCSAAIVLLLVLSLVCAFVWSPAWGAAGAAASTLALRASVVSFIEVRDGVLYRRGLFGWQEPLLISHLRRVDLSVIVKPRLLHWRLELRLRDMTDTSTHLLVGC